MFASQNSQHSAFFSQHNLSMRSYVISVSRRVIINYISSPEVGFLTSIARPRRMPRTTKFIFRFLGQDIVEPTTNQTYGSLLKNLTFIKTFASGIMVPQAYIWPVDPTLYLLPHTSVVSDAHKEGLEVFASDFVNDVPLSYNYSYDPVSEVLSYIDNGDFSVDGVLSDFPVTPSEAIGMLTFFIFIIADKRHCTLVVLLTLIQLPLFQTYFVDITFPSSLILLPNKQSTYGCDGCVDIRD